MDYADFGRYLSQQRELRGMSREEVSAATKIPAAVLSALEEGRFERMPARVFVLNFIRAYAEAIGLAADEAVLRFEEVDETVKTSPPPSALERDRRQRAWITFALVLAALLVAGYFVFVWAGHVPHR